MWGAGGSGFPRYRYCFYQRHPAAVTAGTTTSDSG
jgi:hypothetical protein